MKDRSRRAGVELQLLVLLLAGGCGSRTDLELARETTDAAPSGRPEPGVQCPARADSEACTTDPECGWTWDCGEFLEDGQCIPARKDCDSAGCPAGFTCLLHSAGACRAPETPCTDGCFGVWRCMPDGAR